MYMEDFVLVFFPQNGGENKIKNPQTTQPTMSRRCRRQASKNVTFAQNKELLESKSTPSKSLKVEGTTRSLETIIKMVLKSIF